jgi:peptidoglycan/xylan/chitin deacetylase (PgdA/CDA1 family)
VAARLMPLTIVMYHYVRDLARSRYPAIKGRTVADFKGQLDYIARHHTVVTAEEVIAASKGDSNLPANAAWLTFDDGYADHYANVFPLLDARGWQGSFFVPARPVLEGRLLDVNKIHFILAAQPDANLLVEELRLAVESARESGAVLRTWDAYVEDYMGACHLDTPQVLFVKLMLQKGLPEGVRNTICDTLFARFVSADEAGFAAELYCSPAQLKTMIGAGQHVGSHGYAHEWYSSLPRAQQEADVARSLAFLRQIGAPDRDWVMCYPYGGYNADTLDVVAKAGCAVGVTTRSATVDVQTDAPLEYPRRDTIELPVG